MTSRSHSGLPATWHEDPTLTYPGKGKPWLQPLRYDNPKARNPNSLATKAHHLDRTIVRWSGWSLMCWLFQPRAAGHKVEPALLLRTIGRSTGEFRETVLTAFRENDRTWIVIGSNSGFANDPQWVKNLRKNRVAWVWHHLRLRAVLPEEVAPAEYDDVRQFVIDHHPVFPGYELKAGNRQIPFWRLTLRGK